LHLYVELHDLAVSQIALSACEWKDAENGTWVDPARIENLTDNEASLFLSMLIAYQGGKGNNHSIPVIIPTDT